jgi:hypothetical protein
MMDTSSWQAFFVSLLGTPGPILRLFSHINWVAFLLAFLTPTIILFARHEVRLRRLRQIQDFFLNFGTSSDGKAGLATNPTFEFVRSKYTSDLKLLERDKKLFESANESERLRLLITAAEKNRVSFGLRLSFSAFGFMLLCYFGFDLLGRVLSCGLVANGHCLGITQGVEGEELLIIAALTFAGAYIASVRTLLARLSLFDLSSNTFLRVTGESLASILVTVILYAALSATLFAVAGSPGNETERAVPFLWLAFDVALGLLPQSSTKFLLVKMHEKINWIKTTDDRFVDLTRVTSPEVIDGIDYEARFRLEECGIYDVQNLATYNPILMHIETPYKIYQCIDWVAQAQLCHIVGLERFLILRELNIRTIFDLERAIDSIHSPEQYDDIYASVLFAPTERLRQAVSRSHAVFVVNCAGEAKQLNLDDFSRWMCLLISTPPSTMSKAAEHLMAWITDDLHVRRLRRLWNDIADSLEPGSNYFGDSKRHPTNKIARAA